MLAPPHAQPVTCLGREATPAVFHRPCQSNLQFSPSTLAHDGAIILSSEVPLHTNSQLPQRLATNPKTTNEVSFDRCSNIGIEVPSTQQVEDHRQPVVRIDSSHQTPLGMKDSNLLGLGCEDAHQASVEMEDDQRPPRGREDYHHTTEPNSRLEYVMPRDKSLNYVPTADTALKYVLMIGKTPNYVSVVGNPSNYPHMMDKAPNYSSELSEVIAISSEVRTDVSLPPLGAARHPPEKRPRQARSADLQGAPLESRTTRLARLAGLQLQPRALLLLCFALLITGELGGAVGVRNCLLSRQQCADDPACRSILDIVPRVCGPESVACSTVTVNKCLAALRTLQGFPYFQPTCLCREPHVDRECNTFHEFIFDHPCSFVQKNAGASPYAVHALPTCEYALRACESLPGCSALHNNFRRACNAESGVCKMTSSHQCLAAWIKLKMSPMFGCICPNDNQKQECSQIFDMVHQNPCVDELPAFNAPNLIMVSGTDTVGEETLWSVMYPPSAPTTRPRTRPHVHHHSAPHLSAPLPPALPPHHYSNRMVPSNINGNSPPYYPYLPPSVHVVTPAPLTPPPYLTAPPPLIYAAQTQNVLSVAVPSSSTVEGNPLWSFAVNVLPRDNDSASLRRTDGSVMNPLIAPPYSATPGGGTLASGRTLGPSGNSLPSAGGDNSRAASVLGNWYAKANQVPGLSSSSASAAASVAGNAQHSLSASRRDPAVMMQKTCQTSLVECLGDRKCKRLMDGVLATCDASQCSQQACMDNLQKFYRNVDTKWAMDVAFCLCKRSSQTADACLAAQEQLHPTCARKPYGRMPLLCHKLASSCKHDASCRHRLEFYEQACAVDSDTQRCAGSTSECRRALTGILGTELRVLCSCASTDTRETYVCMDWQRILWFNPCVVESQTDYHRVMLQSISPDVELTTSPNIVYPPRLTTEVLSEPVHQSGGSSQQAHLGGSVIGVTRAAENTWQPPTLPPTTTTTRRPTTTTIPPNFCEKHYPSRGKVDHIVEGGGKRFYTVSDPSCSELCLCHAGKKLVCNVLQCVEARPCATSVAIYIHAAPAFMAYRGECLCYSGNFICVRPEHTEMKDGEETQAMYDAGEGLFLFVGFSQAEEELLNPYTHLSVVDSVPRLQALLEEAALAINESHCELALQEQLSQNLIFRVTLPELDEHRDNLTATMQNREKAECMDSLEMVADKINDHHEDVKSDIVLSMFMLAQVHANVPDLPDAGSTARASGVLVSLLCAGALSLPSLTRLPAQALPSL